MPTLQWPAFRGEERRTRDIFELWMKDRMTVRTSQEMNAIRRQAFAHPWPLDDQMTAICMSSTPEHKFLANPAAQYLYVYLSRFVKALSEHTLGRPFSQMDVLDWGCGKGQVSKLLHGLGPRWLESCDLLADRGDSAFGQKTPLLDACGISVTPLTHDYLLPYPDNSFDVVLSVGVLEHVPNDRASLTEVNRVLKPGGLFFCFFLPTDLSWTQKLAHLRGDFYHDRFYSVRSIHRMLAEGDMKLLDVWYRQLLPKNSVKYPFFRFIERLDQAITEYTPLKVFATNVEFVGQKQSG
jgi:SAM-dependent methyltransferase